jgi:hypothetical protein
MMPATTPDRMASAPTPIPTSAPSGRPAGAGVAVPEPISEGLLAVGEIVVLSEPLVVNVDVENEEGNEEEA